MPAQYAHYRFGECAVRELPNEFRKPVQRLRGLFDLGLQGPDLFFYHSYTSRTRICDLGFKLHAQTGREFFTRRCEQLRRNPTEEGKVYLYGVLAHYCLDSLCHPFVNTQTAASHLSLEAEFDRFLLATDGYDLSCQGSPVPLAISKKAARPIAGLYPGVSPRDLRASVRSMNFAHRMLSTPSRAGRKLVSEVLRRTGGHYLEMQLTERENKKCSHLNGQLLERFDRALVQYPLCLRQLSDHLNHGTPFGPQFSPDFG